MEYSKNFPKNLSVSLVLILIALFLIKALNISYPVSVTTANRSSELAVVGEGRVETVPDTAYISAGVTVDNAASVAAAQRTMNTVNNKIISSVTKLGIDKKDIKTTNYSVNPNYQYLNNINVQSGYNANATVEIKLKETEKVSLVIDAVTEAGANQIQGVRFAIDKPESFREQAREAAIKNAREQAQKLAKSLGIKLGKIVNIVESSSDNPPSLMKSYAESMGGAGGSGLPDISGGSQTVTSVVTLYFEKR